MMNFYLALLFFFILRVHSTFEEDRIIALPDQPAVDFHQYGGYVTVDENHGRKLFYYFVEAEVDPASKPVILWISGGPICSTNGWGAFTGNGPFRATSKGLVKNPFSWNKEANMLYLDSPAGFGFSYSANSDDYLSVNDEFTARDNLVFLQLWFSKFSHYQTNDFFIAGENYAGHYAPQLAQFILQTQVNFNLKGIAIGNPLLDFDNDFNSAAEFLSIRGIISEETFEMLKTVCNISTLKRQFQSGNISTRCSEVNLQLSKEVASIDPFNVNADMCPPPREQQAYMLVEEQAGKEAYDCVGVLTNTYLNRKDVQNALHAKLVGVKSWSSCNDVVAYDFQSLEKPTLSLLGTLVKSGVRVLVYSGNLDSVIPSLGTASLIKHLVQDFGFNITKRHGLWSEDGQVGGPTMEFEDMLTFASLLRAGHSVPFSQPEISLKMIRNFLKGRSLHNENRCMEREDNLFPLFRDFPFRQLKIGRLI